MRGYSRDALPARNAPAGCRTPRPSSSSTTRTPFRSSSRIRSNATGFASFRPGTARRRSSCSPPEPVDLVVLDIMLPKLDGLEVCKRLRAESSVPIIMLTARDDEFDTVLGLELGADDYITKPFSIREFRSRVRALLRRAGASRRDAPRGRAARLGWRLARPRPARSRVDGRALDLTYVEFELLRTLVGAAGQGLQPARAACRRSGAIRRTVSRGRSTSTSAISARRWSATRASPS